MQIQLDRRSTKQIQQSAVDAIEDGDTETLREDVIDAFREEQIDEIERRIEGSDFYEFVGEAVEEWDGDDVGELFELLEAHLSDVGIELKVRLSDLKGEDDDDDDDEPAVTDDTSLGDGDDDSDVDDDGLDEVEADDL